MADISEIHEKVLAFLLDWRATRDPELRFTLRKRPIERLEKGYWFLGNENYLAFSFWNAKDWVNKTDSIYFEISSNGVCSLRITGKDDPTKEKFFEYVTKVLGDFHQGRSNGNLIPIWSKDYERGDYLIALENFIQKDKERIDEILQREIETNASSIGKSIAFLTEEEFQIGLKKQEYFRFYLRISQAERNKREKRKEEFRLLTLQIENVGIFGDSLSVIEFGNRATALIGENGCGKTTILRAIALGLLGTGSQLIDITSAELQSFPTIRSIDEEAIPQYQGNGRISVSYVYDQETFQNGKANVITFTIPKATGFIEFRDEFDDQGFGLPVGESDEDGELPYLVLGYPQRYGTKSDGTNFYKRSKAPNAYDVIPLILKTEDNRIDSLKVWISETWNTTGHHKGKVIALFKLISDVLSIPSQPRFEVRLLHAVSAQKIVVSTPVNPEGILYDLLSTGLENLFGWLGHMISRMYEAYPKAENPLHEPAIVFIDEIDNYLHPEVQMKLMKILLDSFPKTQFIFTAHSPFILSALPSKDAKAYRIEDGKAVPIRHFYGQTIQNLAYDQFGIKKRPVEIQDKIDEMTWAFSLEDLPKAKALFAELRPILGDDDPAILDAMMDLEESERSHAPN